MILYRTCYNLLLLKLYQIGYGEFLISKQKGLTF